MIRKLRFKMIIASMASLLAVLAAIVIIANAMNFRSVSENADNVLEILTNNDGKFPPPHTSSSGDDSGSSSSKSSNEGTSEGTSDSSTSSSGSSTSNGSSNGSGDSSTSSSDNQLRDSSSEDNSQVPPAAPGPFDSGRLLDPRFESAELPYESRYFSVLMDIDGRIIFTDISRIASVDEDTADEYARSVLSEVDTSVTAASSASSDRTSDSSTDSSAAGASETDTDSSDPLSDSGKSSDGSFSILASGYYSHYRYAVTSGVDESGGARIRVIFLDCGQRLHSARLVLFYSTIVALCGWGAVLCLLILVSGRIVAPIAESYEKQRRFITDAGHEIKTPITIINADADVLSMDLGPNEWLDDIKVQASRLTSLTGDLIFLSRMDEEQQGVQKIDLPFSDLVEETAGSFRQLAKSRKKDFQISIEPLITVHGDPKSLRQLVSILLDNAQKYSPEGGRITLVLRKEGRNAVLTVDNTSSYPITDELLKNMFDRFYRADESRNSETGGYGIGLSIARAVVSAHKGKISGSSEEGRTLKITVSLPAIGEKAVIKS